MYYNRSGLLSQSIGMVKRALSGAYFWCLFLQKQAKRNECSQSWSLKKSHDTAIYRTLQMCTKVVLENSSPVARTSYLKAENPHERWIFGFFFIAFRKKKTPGSTRGK